MTNWHIPLIMMLFVLIDILSGLIKGYIQKDLSSTKLRQGLANKSTYVLVVALAYVCEYAMLYMDLGFTAPLVPLACTYIIVTEIVSIIENVAEINPTLQNSKLFELFHVDGDNDD